MPKHGNEAIDAARFALARAQQAAYYAHKQLVEHPGQPEAQQGYRAANRRCEEAVAALKQVEAGRQAEAE